MARNQQLRARNDLDRIVPGQRPDIAELVLGVVRVVQQEGEALLLALAERRQVLVIRAEHGVQAAAAALGRKLEPELRRLGQRDLDHEHLQQHLGRNHVEPVEQRLDARVGARRGADHETVQHSVREDADRRIEEARTQVGLRTVGERRPGVRVPVPVVVLRGVPVRGGDRAQRIGADGSGRGIDGLGRTLRVVDDRERLRQLRRAVVADFVDENALLVDRIGAVENVDPLLDLLDRILRRGRNHDHLEPVDADQLDRSGQLGLVGGLRHRETEHGQDILQLLDHLGRQDVAARHRHAGPVAARALVDDFENLAQLRDIARIVADQDRVRTQTLSLPRNGLSCVTTSLAVEFLSG